MSRADRRVNNFDAVRLVAALTVLIGHCWSLTGRSGGLSIAGVPAFTVAVWVFFSVSGYLITSSWNMTPALLPFLARRIGRICPALAVTVLCTVFVIGPSITARPISEYFGSPQTWEYLSNIAFVARYEIPGVFDHLPRPVVNGSLWTVGPEFCCYLLIAVIGIAGYRLGARRRSLIRTGALATASVSLALTSVVVGHGLGGAAPVVEAAVFFTVGGVIAHLPRGSTLPLVPALLGVVGWWVAGALSPDLSPVVGWVVVPYASIAVGTRRTPVLRDAGRVGDLSYGTYLWGFPLQQLVVTAAPDSGLPTYVGIVVPLTLAVAFVSWHLIERPALDAARRWAATREGPAVHGSAGPAASVGADVASNA